MCRLRSPNTGAGAWRLLVTLLLTAILGGGVPVAAVDITQDVYAMLIKNHPKQPVGGRHKATAVTPPREIHWTFEGIDYDNPPHQVASERAIRDRQSCVGEYTRCILRESKAQEVCALDAYLGYYHKFHSLCDMEYQNCQSSKIYFKDKKIVDFRQNRFIYDADGWRESYSGWFGWSSWWYCFAQDRQTEQGWRRAAARAGGAGLMEQGWRRAAARATRAALLLVAPLLSETSSTQNVIPGLADQKALSEDD